MKNKSLILVLGICTFLLFIIMAHSQTLNDPTSNYQKIKNNHTGPVYSGKDYAVLGGHSKIKKGCT